jgi:hypothetical protein
MLLAGECDAIFGLARWEDIKFYLGVSWGMAVKHLDCGLAELSREFCINAWSRFPSP